MIINQFSIRQPLALIFGLIYFIQSGATGLGQEIRFMPIRTAPIGSAPGTVGTPLAPTFNDTLQCWEVVVPPGVEIDLDLQARGWGLAVGSPTLGAIQATVVSAGYNNGVGGDLLAKGWPAIPSDGAYRARVACTGDGSPCSAPFDGTCAGGSNGACAFNPGWVMPACAADLAAIATPTPNFTWASAAQNDCNIDDLLVKTMGGLILDVDATAAGTYVIGLDPDPLNSFMTSGSGTPIQGVLFTPACITVQVAPPEEAIPTVSEWGIVIMALLLLVGAKVYFSRRRALQA